MESRRWVNQGLPQTLQIAVFLLYARGAIFALTVVFGGFLSPIGIVFVAGHVAAGYGIANEKRWGYGLGVAMSLLPAALRVVTAGLGALLARDPIGLMFEIALVALLLHPQSRDYQRIWFS